MTWFGTAASGSILFSTDDAGLYDLNYLDGDVKGAAQSLVVSGIAGISIQDGVPASGQILKYDGNQWYFAPDATGDAAIIAHELLSPFHSDTTPHTPVAGDLIVGSGGNVWSALSIGSAGQVVYSDGTDVKYVQLGQNTPFASGSASAPSVVFQGDADTGMYSAGQDIISFAAGGASQLTIDGGNDLLTIDMGQVVKVALGGTATLTSADYMYLVNSVPATVTLPASPTAGQIYFIKDSDGAATPASFITIDGNGNTIDGNATIRIRRSYGAFTIVYNGAAWNII